MLTPGQAHDLACAEPLLERCSIRLMRLESEMSRA